MIYGESGCTVHLRESGRFGFAAPEGFASVLVNGTNRTESVREEDGFYEIDLEESAEETLIEIRKERQE